MKAYYSWNRQHTSMNTVIVAASLLSAPCFDEICGKGFARNGVRGNL